MRINQEPTKGVFQLKNTVFNLTCTTLAGIVAYAGYAAAGLIPELMDTVRAAGIAGGIALFLTTPAETATLRCIPPSKAAQGNTSAR